MGDICGIYQINVKNNIYVGSSKNINRRYWEHLWKLKNKKHPNTHMQNLYDKYQENSFVLSVLEKCDIENLIINEQKWIEKLNPNINKAPVAGTTLGLKLSQDQCENRRKINTGRIHSKESIQKRIDKIKGRKYSDKHKNNIRLSKLGKKVSKESIAKRILKTKKSIACYDLNNVLIKIYDSAKDAALETGYYSTNITRCCKNKLKTYKNLIWRYYVR